MTERVLRLVSGRRDTMDEGTAVAGRGDAAVVRADAGWRELSRELDRSRRFGRSFSLLRLPRVAADGNGGLDLARALPDRLRSLDTVWSHRRQLFVLLPEADRDATLGLVTRLRRELPALVAADVRLAAFPGDALTAGALLELLDRRRVDETPSLDVALQHRLTSA